MVLMLLCSVSLSLFSNSLAAGRHTPLQLGKHRTPTFDLNRNVLEKRRHRWFPGSGAKRRDQCFGEHSAFRLKKIQRAFSSTLGIVSPPLSSRSLMGPLQQPRSDFGRRQAHGRSKCKNSTRFFTPAVFSCKYHLSTICVVYPPANRSLCAKTKKLEPSRDSRETNQASRRRHQKCMGLEEPQHRPAISDTSQVPKSLRISFCAIDLHWRLPMYSESSANLNFEQFIGISLGMQQPIKGRTFACSASRIQLATVMVASAQNKTRADLRQTNNTPLPSSPIPHCYLFAIPRRLQPTLKVEFPGFTLARGTAYSIWLVNAPKLKDQPTHFSTTPQTPKPRPSGRGDYARLRRKRRVEKAEIIAFSPHKGILGRVTGLVDGAGSVGRRFT
ncbi:hypothetical protein C8R46DRAFT_1043673 [Mycena filopes]|nr:hypothetical protein C8R46DRAFT_1043673 [Mycena filopes]